MISHRSYSNDRPMVSRAYMNELKLAFSGYVFEVVGFQIVAFSAKGWICLWQLMRHIWPRKNNFQWNLWLHTRKSIYSLQSSRLLNKNMHYYPSQKKCSLRNRLILSWRSQATRKLIIQEIDEYSKALINRLAELSKSRIQNIKFTEFREGIRNEKLGSATWLHNFCFKTFRMVQINQI